MTSSTRGSSFFLSSSSFTALSALIYIFNLIVLSLAIPKSSDCKGEGFYRNPDDCSRFYRCVPSFTGKFSVFHFSCPAGTVFDEKFGVCNYEWNTKSCSDNTGSGSSTVHLIVEGPSGPLGIPIVPELDHPIFGSKPVPTGPQEVLVPLHPSHPNPFNPLEHPHQPIYPVGHPNHPFDKPTHPLDHLDEPPSPANHPVQSPQEHQDSNGNPGTEENQTSLGHFTDNQGQIFLPIPSHPAFEPTHPVDQFETSDEHFPSLPPRPHPDQDHHFPNRPTYPQVGHDQHFSGFPPYPVDQHHPNHQQAGHHHHFQGRPNPPQGVIHRPFRPFPGHPRPIPGHPRPIPGQPRPIPGQHRPGQPRPVRPRPFPGGQRPPFPSQHHPGHGNPFRPLEPQPGRPTRPNRPFAPPADNRPHRPIPGRPILGGSYPKPVGPIPENQRPSENRPVESPAIDTAEDNQIPDVIDKPDLDSDGLPVGNSPDQVTGQFPSPKPTNPGQYPPENPPESSNDVDNILFPGQQLPEYQPEGYPDGFPLNPEPGVIVGKPPQSGDNYPIEIDANPEIFPGGPGDVLPDGEYIPEIGDPGQAPAGIEIEDGFTVNFPKPSFEDDEFAQVETDLIPANENNNGEENLDIEVSDNPFTTPGSILSSTDSQENQQNNELVGNDNKSEQESTSNDFRPNDKGFINLPHSVYQCEEPGFFGSQTGCHEFYVCQEVLPGKLLADQVYRCPNRYLFDEVTQRCQREEKVTCNKFSLGYEADGKENVLVVLEQYLNEFFGTPLKYEETRERFGISPISA